MKNRLDEILSLMNRMDNIDADGDNSNVSPEEYYNGGNVASPIVQGDGTKKETSYVTNFEPIKKSEGDEVLFTDMIERIGLYRKKKQDITLEDIENSFVNYIKNRKIFCPNLPLNDLRNEILIKNDEKDGEQEIEFDKESSTKNLQKTKTSLKVFGRYAPIYYAKVSKNTTGRLGMFFELLFGKAPDNNSKSDFGEGENSVEIKTKHESSDNGVIAITKVGLEGASDLFDSNSELIFSGDLKRQLVIVLNERLNYITKKDGLTFDDIIINIYNEDSSKKYTKRKSIPIRSKIEDGAVVIDNDKIATITFNKIGDRNRSGLIAGYNVTLSGTLRRKGSKWSIELLVSLHDVKDSTYDRNIQASVPINYLLGKVEAKCPTLVVAVGDDTNYKIDGWDCQSDVYMYRKADIFRWGGLDDDEITLYLIKSGLLKINFGISTGVFRNTNSIVLDSVLSFNYHKLINSLKTFGREIFSEQQLFVHEKEI